MPSRRALVLLAPLIMSRSSPLAYTPYPFTWSAGKSAGFQLRSTLCVNWRSRWSRLGDGTPNRQTHMTTVRLKTSDTLHRSTYTVCLSHLSSSIPLNTTELLGGLAAIAFKTFYLKTELKKAIAFDHFGFLNLVHRYPLERELPIPATVLLLASYHLLIRSKCLYFI